MSEQQFQDTVMAELHQAEERQSAFSMLRRINVNEHTEKKNNLTYLSWAWAVDQLLQRDPHANWRYEEPVRFGETMMVFCTVTAFQKSMTAQLPVMDHRNKAIPNPDAFQVNTAMQRCLAKAIALHGLGLYIYAGEDLPETDKPDDSEFPEVAKKLESVEDLAAELKNLPSYFNGDKDKATRFWQQYGKQLKGKK